MRFVEKLKTKMRGSIDLDQLKRKGLVVGKNFHVMEGVIIDLGHCWLIEIGDNVTLAPRVHVLAHDASTKNVLGYTKIGCVTIGDNVFVGAGTIILPNVKISANAIVGAGSVVSKSLTSGVWVGNPCVKVAEYDEWVLKQKERMSKAIIYDESYIIGNITENMKREMKEQLKSVSGGYIV